MNDYDFVYPKMEIEFTNEHHWGANKKVTDINNKGEQSPETLGLTERWWEIAKPGKPRLQFDCNFNRRRLLTQTTEQKKGDTR